MTRRHHRCNDVVRSTASSLLINILYQGWPDKTSFERCILGGNIRNSHALTKKKRFFTVWWWFVYFRLLESLLSGNLREGYHMEKPGVDGRIILKLILEKRAGEHALERYGLRQGHVAGSCESCNETSGSIKCGGFLEQLRTCQVLTKDSTLWSKLLCPSLYKIFKSPFKNRLICI